MIISYGTRTKIGVQPYKHGKVNQDSYFALNDFCGINDLSFFGVMDGHGINGKQVSEFVKNQLPCNNCISYV